MGVGLLLPFVETRFLFPFRPILVSPLGAGASLSRRGLAVLANEALWVGVPSAVLAWWAVRPGRKGERANA